MTRLRHLFRCLAISWFLFCFVVTLALTMTDHWLAYAIALTPLPSLLVPVSLAGLVLLLLIQRRSAPWALAALVAGLVLTPYELGRWGHGRGAPSEMDEPAKLTVLSANVGQRERQELIDFAEATRPDLVAIQAGGLPAGLEWLDELDQMDVGRLSLRSRWPIQDGEPIRDEDDQFAARFEVAWPPAPLVVYVMHLPTPRFVLGDLRGRGILRAENRKAAAEFQERKRRLLGKLVELIAEEPGPVLLVGDANQPACGPAYRMLISGLRDGHRVAGWGFAPTVPGSVNSPLLRPLGPWSRIDYILANEGLEFLEHYPEPPHPGQHRAVLARLKPSSTP